MEIRFLCPRCRAKLNPKHELILRGERAGKRGLFLFSPELGDYTVVVPEELALKSNEQVEFSCPVCIANLTSSHDRNMTELLFSGANGEGRVAFSKIFGRHATYIVNHGAVRSFGEHAVALDVNFWGEGPQ